MPNRETAAPNTFRRLQLRLPESLVQDVIRLAELRGRDFNREIGEDLAFLLNLSGGPKPGTMLADLFEASRTSDPLAQVVFQLPAPLAETLSVLAHSYGATRSLTLTALLQRGVRRLLRAEIACREQGLSWMDAWMQQHDGLQAA